MYRYILRESCSQLDSLPLTSLTIFLTCRRDRPEDQASRRVRARRATTGLQRVGRGAVDALFERRGCVLHVVQLQRVRRADLRAGRL